MRLLVGDSHVRSYVNSPEFNHAIFLGPGKEVNFTSAGGMLSYFLRLSILKWIVSCDWSDTSIALVVGEPDVRFACYQHWWIKDKPIVLDAKTIQNNIENSISRVDRVLAALQRYNKIPCDVVIGAGTPNTTLIPYAHEFNRLLKSVCEQRQIAFFDPQTSVETNGALSAYIRMSVMNPNIPDNTHLSEKIGLDLSAGAQNLGLDAPESHPLLNVKDGGSTVQYFENFASYRIKYSLLLKLVLKVLKVF